MIEKSILSSNIIIHYVTNFVNNEIIILNEVFFYERKNYLLGYSFGYNFSTNYNSNSYLAFGHSCCNAILINYVSSNYFNDSSNNFLDMGFNSNFHSSY